MNLDVVGLALSNRKVVAEFTMPIGQVELFSISDVVFARPGLSPTEVAVGIVFDSVFRPLLYPAFEPDSVACTGIGASPWQIVGEGVRLRVGLKDVVWEGTAVGLPVGLEIGDTDSLISGGPVGVLLGFLLDCECGQSCGPRSEAGSRQ